MEPVYRGKKIQQSVVTIRPDQQKSISSEGDLPVYVMYGCVILRHKDVWCDINILVGTVFYPNY
jgi:hypothetical protein